MPAPSEIVQGILAQNTRDVALLGARERQAVFRAIAQAELELATALTEWLSGAVPGDKFTAGRHARLIRQIGPLRGYTSQLAPETARALEEARASAAVASVSHATYSVERLAFEFTGSVTPVSVDVPTILARGNRLLIKRHSTSAARYGMQAREWLGRQLAVGVLKQESFDQMSARIVRLVRQPVPAFPDRAPAMARGLFMQPRHAINRLVRTEAIHAYNTYHNETIGELDMDKRWDAALDRRGCLVCRGLDGEIVKHNENFSSGDEYPPNHPHCRCVIVPWDPEWGDVEGVPTEGTEQIEPPMSGAP